MRETAAEWPLLPLRASLQFQSGGSSSSSSCSRQQLSRPSCSRLPPSRREQLCRWPLPRGAPKGVARLLGVVLLAALGPHLTAADLDFKAFTKDPQGYASHIRLVDGSRIDYYSDEFTEFCPEVGAGPIAPANPRGKGCDAEGGSCIQGISQRFQHPQVREVSAAERERLETMYYMTDEQLDNPFAGRVANGNYTESVATKEFIPDGDLLPLPHTRTQLCHYALRLTQPKSAQNSAAWSRFKQLIAYGFETEFHFRVFHRTKECYTAGVESEWCEEAGADGFAFVIQNEGRKIVGNDIAGHGYGFRYSIAVEFDMYRNADLGENSANHISVQVPFEKGQPNSADHTISSVAYTDDIPLLQEGTHVVRISYDTKSFTWDDLGKDYDSDVSGAYLRLHSSGRPGLLTVELDGRRVIAVPIDLAYAVNVDGTGKMLADTPRQPDPEAYDEKGASPGRAWVGFSSSTSYFQYQSVDILSWTFKEHPPCPRDNMDDARATLRGRGDEVRCLIHEGTQGRSTCTWDGREFCGLILQNAGRSAFKISAHTKHHAPNEYEGCLNGILEWDALHPWFLGCRRTVRFTHELQQLWITSLDGSRSLILDDPQILQKEPSLFKRESLFEYCIMEHKYDPFAFYIAECHCEFCMRLVTISASYAVFYQHMCSARYGKLCPCFEASEVTHDMSLANTLEPLRHMRLHVCRGCTYTSHCAKMLKVAVCQPSYAGYQLGNPFAPTILDNGFENLSLDQDRVVDGRLRGDSCNCEPQVRPYIGDVEGRSGLCSELGSLGTGSYADLFGCAEFCRSKSRCNFLTYWESTQECRIYKDCFWELCQDDYCFKASTYRNADLGSYLTMRGDVQEFTVFPQRTVQTTYKDCKDCLHLYDEEHCLHQCGSPLLVPYLHWPAGPSCATCMFAGNRMHELTTRQAQLVKECVYSAISASEDPWVVCQELVMREAGVSTLDLFNGVSTHYLSECPGRSFDDIGGVCIPNTLARFEFPMQVLSRMAAIDDTVWGDQFVCLSANCEIVPDTDCYVRWAEWPLNIDAKVTSFKVPNLQSTVYNLAPITGGIINAEGEVEYAYLDLNKRQEQFMVTEPIPLDLENATIEAWVELSTTERITNIVLGVPAESNSEWKEDYLSSFANDGIMTTYWSSQVGQRGRMQHRATLWIELGGFQYGGGVAIYWKEPASDFSVFVSVDNETWEPIIEVKNNRNTFTEYLAFFGAEYVKLEMYRAATVRGPGIDEGRPVFSIYEIEVNRDTNVARLKNTRAFHYFNRIAPMAVDGDWESYWATPPHSPTAYILVDLGRVNLIQVTRISWRYKPQKIKVYVGRDPCSTRRPTKEMASFVESLVLPVMQLQDPWTGRCLLYDIEETALYYGEQLVAVREIEAYIDAVNIVPNAKVVETWPSVAYHLTHTEGCLDGDPETYWLMQPTDGTASITIDLGDVFWVMSMEIKFAEIEGAQYKASRYKTFMGLELGTTDGFPNMIEKDAQQGSTKIRHYFQVFDKVRFVTLSVEQIMGSNPKGRLGFEDIIIRTVSDNLANRSVASVETSSSWSNCSDCMVDYDGRFRQHDGSFAVDDNFETWWGAPYGIKEESGAYLEITLASMIAIDIAAVRWKYPAFDVLAQCSPDATGNRFDLVGATFKNFDYITPVVFYSTYQCHRIRIALGANLEILGQKGVIGIREVEIYSTAVDLLLGMPIEADDGTFAPLATDESDVTTWMSKTKEETSLVADTEANFTAWGFRILSPSTSIISSFDVQVSDDGENWDNVYSLIGNTKNDLWIIHRFEGRYIKLVCKSTIGSVYFIYTFRVFGTPNEALGQATFAPQRWDHSGAEAVDGINNTFWLSEPLSTTATLRLDLGEETFVAGGVTLEWMYAPEDFDIYLSNDTETWALLWNITGNLENDTSIGCPDNCFWEARYLEIRMTRASKLNGDGLFALYGWNVYFDVNLAHFKEIQVDRIMYPDQFKPDNAIDGDIETLWMPEQASHVSALTLDLTFDHLVCGFTIYWRRPPVRYRVEYERADTFEWLFVNRWSKRRGQKTVDRFQEWFDGFPARRIKVHVEEVEESPEGRVVALQDVLLQVWDRSDNLALRRPVQVSEETILGNMGFMAVDGNEFGTYWWPFDGTKNAWIILELDPLPKTIGGPPAGHDVGRIIVMWRWPPGDVWIDRQYDGDVWVNIYHEFQEDFQTDWAGMRKCTALRFTMDTNGIASDLNPHQNIGIKQIKVWRFMPKYPLATEPDEVPWKTIPFYMVDPDIDTYWMGPPLDEGDRINIWLDLGKLYNATDIEIYFGFRPQVLFLFVSEDGENMTERRMTSGATLGLLTLEEQGVTFRVRYVKLLIMRGYQDPDGGQWGTTIRDFGVLQFANMARGKPTVTNSIWEYPPAWSNDESMSTEWTSRFGALEAQLIYDLGESKNVAGMTFVFGHIAGRYQVHFADTNTNVTVWEKAYSKNGNIYPEAEVPAEIHFKGRYIRISLFDPETKTFWHPDYFEDVEEWGSLFSVKDVKIYEHTGGGGVFGFQSVDGMQYTAVAYALQQPEKWIISSEEDKLTKELTTNASDTNDIGKLIHLALTKKRIGGDATHRKVQLALYRNGLPYGMPYEVTEEIGRMNGPGKSRIVIGARSSAHYPEPGPGDPDPREGVIHGKTHSPFFSGRIYNVTLLKNALEAGEVRGLYEVHAQGGQELGCHCYDACPTGANRFFPDVQVPCSGQGVCLRTSGRSFGGGRCQCQQGYSGDNCEKHCSELSIYGCCEVDDDCPAGVRCNEATRACAE